LGWLLLLLRLWLYKMLIVGRSVLLWRRALCLLAFGRRLLLLLLLRLSLLLLGGESILKRGVDELLKLCGCIVWLHPGARGSQLLVAR